MNYYFEDFTETNYKKILERLLYKGYRFSEFDYETINSDERIALWRHDVDFSLNRAYSLSEIESELGTKATYFIHLQSSFYNVFEPSQYELICRIIEKGHMIGLHFDHGFYAQNKHLTSDEEIEKFALIEKDILEKYFNIEINIVSFHNPEASNALCLQQDYYGGMLNVYSKTISDNCKYCSDSNGYWRYDRLQDVIEKNYKRLHILTHPTWWVPNEMSPYDRIKRCIDGRRNAILESYCDMLTQFGRENIGGVKTGIRKQRICLLR